MSIKPKLPVEDFYLQFPNFFHHLGNENVVKPKLHRINPSMAKKHKGLNLKALRNRSRHVKVVRKAGGGGVSGSGKLDLNITMNNCGSAGGQGGAGVTSLGGMASGMTGQLNPTNNLTPNPYGSANPFMGQTNRQQYLQPQVIKQTTQTQPVQGYLGCAQAFATPQQGGTPVCTSAGSTPQQVPTMPSLGMLGMGGLGKIPQPPPLTAAQQKVQDELQKWESSQESQGSMVQGWEITGKLNQLNQQYDPTAPFIMPIN